MKSQNKLNHVAIIMDGNGRWAAKQGLSRLEGHKQGVKSVKKIIRYADKYGRHLKGNTTNKF